MTIDATDRYNVLPWWFTLDKLFAFAVLPMSTPPTNPLTYTGYPKWPFFGGPGYLIAIKFADSPIGAYNEIFFIPGMYKPKCSLISCFSVQRIWVDSLASKHAGRSIWGIPKEMATFNWTESAPGAKNSWTSLVLTDNASGKVAFRANMTDLVLGPEMTIPSWLLPSNVRKVVAHR
ncbi:hypothetical protein OEZ86_009787 [Tetradesmus obliquus]|uniref:Acetoacetate decarboxylase n=1 Tax=Tetradesmus obliquus TaxID=3088 RepID=A0ABY8UMR9_TETOB|nr:hypothetical protein OEZ85_001229 [Tetradesmus obliquus]WIA43285.1 hypothetical protein OEZ86_009787 [Tetradesmus obliquus]